MIGSNSPGEPSWKPEKLTKAPGCRAAEVSGARDPRKRLRGFRRGPPGLRAVGSPGNKVKAEGVPVSGMRGRRRAPWAGWESVPWMKGGGDVLGQPVAEGFAGAGAPAERREVS